MMLKIKDHELMPLYRTIVEAKFHGETEDPVIPYSEPISDLSLRISNAVVDMLKSQGAGDQAKHWLERTRLNEDWELFQLIKSRIRSTNNWSVMATDEKNKLIGILCAPFIPSNSQINQLIEYGNQNC